MAQQSPEAAGFWSRLKRIFRPKEIPPTPIPPQTPKTPKSAETKKRDLSDQEAAEQIDKELRKITPSHKAIEVLNGVAFSKDTLAHNRQLRNLLLDIIYRSTQQNLGEEARQKDWQKSYGAQAYHQRQWLDKVLREIQAIEPSLVGTTDAAGLAKLKDNLEKLKEQAVTTDDRLAEDERRLEGARTGQPVSSVEQFKQAVQTIEKDKTEEGRRITELVRSKVDNLDEQTIAELADEFKESMSKMVQKVDQTKPEKLDEFTRRYDHMRKGLEKLARLFAETHPQEGRFANEVFDRRTGRKKEELERAIHEDPNLMDYWFYKILEPVLFNAHLESHRDLYNLYTMADMEAFMDIISRKKDAQGNNIGLGLVGHYTTLKNVILQSHDMDYYAAHPMQDMREFMSSTAQFTNEYVNFAHQDPLVALAKRAYEVALLQIREDHGGYIPREYLTWERGRMVSQLDERVEKIVKAAIKNGQLFHEKIDPVTGKADLNRWGRVRSGDKPITLEELYGGQPAQSTEWQRQLGDLKLSASLKQAKGLALVDIRLLEIIARSKGTGSDMETVKEGNYGYDAEGRFNSVPYEGIVRHIEPIIHHFTRWRIAKENYLAFFSIMITEKDHSWSHEKIKKLIDYHRGDDREAIRKEFGDDLDTRLLAMDNPFAFSGMWGTMTGWRIADASVDWDDWEKEKYSTANKLMTTGNRFIKQGGHDAHKDHEIPYGDGRAKKKVDDYFLYQDNRYKGADGQTAKYWYDHYKKTYRQRLLTSGDWSLVATANDDHEFEKKWRTTGLKQKDTSTGKSYQDNLEAHLKSVQKTNKGVEQEKKDLEMKLERAYRARIWVQAAMRSPLIVARECQSDFDIAGYKREKTPLRKKIIYDLIGIDLDEFTRTGTPTVEEKHILDTITDIEAAVFSVQQVAIRLNRDLEDKDFNELKVIAKTPHEILVAQYAKRYWETVKSAMLGDSKSAHEWYQKIGIEDADENLPLGLRFHDIHWDKINGISLHHKGEKVSIFEHPDNLFQSDLLTGKLVDRDWRYLFSTEDMAWEYLNMGALGQRNPMRRAGDLGSHVGFNQGLEEILVQMLAGKLPKEDFIKKLKEMWIAMSGDAGEPATEACSRVFYSVMQLYRTYDWAWQIPIVGPAIGAVKPTSVMQEIFGKMHGDSMSPNELLRMVHMAEQAGIFPPRLKSKLTDKPVYPGAPQPNWDAHIMEQKLKATLNDVVYELATLAFLLAMAITIYRAFTAKSEEEESGGGGGGRD